MHVLCFFFFLVAEQASWFKGRERDEIRGGEGDRNLEKGDFMQQESSSNRRLKTEGSLKPTRASTHT